MPPRSNPRGGKPRAHRVDPVFPLIRTVIHEVIADIDPEAAEIVLVVHWIGGVHSEMRLPRRRRGQRNSTSADVIAAVRQLALIANDDLIAGILNRVLSRFVLELGDAISGISRVPSQAATSIG